MRMKDIRVSHLEGTILNAKVGDSTKSRIKSLFNMMYKYAVAHDIVEKDYAEVVEAAKESTIAIKTTSIFFTAFFFITYLLHYISNSIFLPVG